MRHFEDDTSYFAQVKSIYLRISVT
jgi:hypothetical protein